MQVGSLAELFSRINDDRLKNAQLIQAQVNREERGLDLIARFDRIISVACLEEMKNELAVSYRLNYVNIHPTYSPELFSTDILDLVTPYSRHPQLSAVLMGAECVYENNVLTIRTKGKGLTGTNSEEELAEVLNNQFGINPKIEIIYKTDAELLEEYEKEKEAAAEKAAQEAKKRATQASGANSDSPIIYGREFKINEVTPLSEIDELSGYVLVEGELFMKEIETRETRSGKYIVLFDITDNESSIRCKIFIDDKKTYDSVAERLKKGVCVCVKGQAVNDKYAREVLIDVNSIMEIPPLATRMDNSEEKRVELHLHTQMSTMDALTDVKAVISRAIKWGHKAVAITDHGVVQAYPFAMDAIPRGSDFKVIYGMEAYLVDIGRPIVYLSNEQPLCSEAVAVTVTENENTIEINAVKIKDNNICEPFLANINKNDEECDALNAFTEYSKDAFFITKNGKSDMEIIKNIVTEKCGIEYQPTFIDISELSKCFYPKDADISFETIAEKLGTNQGSEQEILGNIWLKYREMLSEKNVDNLENLNVAFDEVTDIKKKPYYHAIFFAKNPTGLKNLYKIVSYSHINTFFKKPRVSKSLFYKFYDGIITGSACEAGELYRAFLEEKDNEEISRIASFYDYYEVQPLGNNDFMIRGGLVKSQDELIDINKKIVNLGEEHNKLVVATCDVHFLDPHHSKFRAILQAGQGYSDADYQAPLYLRTTEEMLEEFSYLPEQKAREIVIENTNKIADMCQKLLPVPEETCPPVWETAPEEIESMSIAKAKRIYGEELPTPVKERMDKELNSIITYGFSVMYLIAQRLVTKSNADGYLVGSRGSVGSSFVAFLSDITEVNALPPHYVCPDCKNSEFVLDGTVACGFDMPEKKCPKCGADYIKDGHDIPFETFLGFAGDKEPDIDLNFSGDYQPRAHKYTEVLFGEGHVFRAGTIGTLADKTAYGFVKKYLDERNIIASSAEINRLTQGCTGVKRTTGQHPGGVMILPQGHDIHEFCPIQKPADKQDIDIITTHFDYHSISGRLLKLDILGHDDPTMIRMLEDLTGVDAKGIYLGDKDTMSLFTGTDALGVSPEDLGSEVGTFGVPEFGTKFTRQMLLDTKPTTFAELVRISGLSHGTDVWVGNAQELVRSGTATLKETICTRDDIMLYLIYNGLPKKESFTIMERVRKGKGLTEENIALMNENNIPGWYIDSCQKIKYMFPKAHAVAYVTMAFRIAWFKVHRPIAYYATFFTVRADDFDAEFMLDFEKAKRKRKEIEAMGNEAGVKEKSVLTILELVCEMFLRGFKFLPIDIYKSDSERFIPTEEGLLPPLNSLAGLGTNAAKAIVEARNEQPFKSIEDLRVRGKVSKTIIELMRNQGCLDGMDESSQMTFF